MYKYRNTNDGRIVTTTCRVHGNQWEELTEEQVPESDQKNQSEDQVPKSEQKDQTKEQAPAKPAKKGKK